MPEPRRDRLRSELAKLRVRAGLSGRALGGRVVGRDGGSLTQATISRIERGETVPSVPTVRAWLVACGADEATTARLLDLAEAVQAETRGWDEVLGSAGHAQGEAAAMEQAATAVRNFQPTVVPGLLQDPAYARAVLSIGRTRDVDAALAARIARQQVLYEPGRDFTFLISEGALRWSLGGRQVHAAQLDRIVSLARLDAVTVAVLPAHQTVACPWNNFILWSFADEPTRVTGERTEGAVDSSDAEVIAWHEELWERLWAAALHGDDALAAVRGAGQSE